MAHTKGQPTSQPGLTSAMPIAPMMSWVWGGGNNSSRQHSTQSRCRPCCLLFEAGGDNAIAAAAVSLGERKNEWPGERGAKWNYAVEGMEGWTAVAAADWLTVLATAAVAAVK